jgi:hypothetical protein
MDGGCRDPQEDTGRQSGPALRVLSAGARGGSRLTSSGSVWM